MKHTLTALLILLSLNAIAQTETIKRLEAVSIKGYYNHQPLLRAVGSVSVLDSNVIKNQSSSSLVGLMNTATGVRMEERSPGSYRLSLRGSLLRSPFGIRNIKIYIDDFPLTDAGGNTYLQLLDLAAVGSLEIYKGPEASIFGANTGGAVLINSALTNTNNVNLSFNAGSYGLFHQTATVNHIDGNYRFNFTEGYQQSDGYRENSALKRRYIQTSQRWDYKEKANLKAFVFYSDLDYQTPGGLTAEELAINPKTARPAIPPLPGALQQKAAIYNKTFFAGLAHEYNLNQNWKHVISLFTSHTNFKNPFITNYEKRQENTLGLRTFIAYSAIKNQVKYNLQAGLESSATKSSINNYGNEKGVATHLKAADDLKAYQNFGFLRANFDINRKLLIEIGASLNFYGYAYQSFFPLAVAKKNRDFKTRLMPKLAASYLVDSGLTIRAAISRGYSPPTLAEVRSSDNMINNDLQAEIGWNYEVGLRHQTKNKRLSLDATLFNFLLKDAIVRRLNTDNIEYFINAGGTKQLGTEIQATYWIIKKSTNNLLNGLQLSSSYTYSHFRFDDFKSATDNYSGNKLTGVPTQNLTSSLAFNFKYGLFLFAQHNYTSSIPLNDANTVFAKSYHLADLKTGIRNLKIGKAHLALSFGINNLFNKAYSLGNDLNAANNRYFNVAMDRNYYVGISISL